MARTRVTSDATALRHRETAAAKDREVRERIADYMCAATDSTATATEIEKFLGRLLSGFRREDVTYKDKDGNKQTRKERIDELIHRHWVQEIGAIRREIADAESVRRAARKKSSDARRATKAAEAARAQEEAIQKRIAEAVKAKEEEISKLRADLDAKQEAAEQKSAEQKQPQQQQQRLGQALYNAGAGHAAPRQ